MAYIGNQPASAFASTEKQTITGNGTTGPYALTHEVAAATDIACFVNNVRQEPGVAYTVSGNQMTMTGNVASTDDFYVVYIGRVVGTVNHPANAPLSATTGTFSGNVAVNARLDVDNLRLDGNTISSTDTNGNVVIDPDGTGSVGINVASPTSQLTIGGNANTIAKPTVQVTDTTAGASLTLRGQSPKLMFDITSSGVPKVLLDGAGIEFKDGTLDAEGNVDVKIGSTGNLMVGKTTDDATTVGVNIRSDKSFFTSDAKEALVLNRNTSEGKIIEFRKDNNTAGEILCFGTRISLSSQGGDGSLSNAGTESFLWAATAFYPNTDNAKDLGLSIRRYDDVFATNGTIQTSDQNEKQDIASLTTAEITAAKAISKLFKTFKWQDKVVAKGDAARTHAGVIAQEVQTAMTDAGLNAADYAFWCSDTWWEADETYTDDDDVEQTRTNTYDTAEEAPEGATQRTRLGVRYPELLAFIGAATEQRLGDIETRLTALENA